MRDTDDTERGGDGDEDDQWFPCPVCGAHIHPPRVGCSVCLWRPEDGWQRPGEPVLPEEDDGP